MAATIRDIKERTGLSLATISKYLNGGNVLPENRIKIKEAIGELNYQVNEMARSLVTSRSKTIGVVVFDIANVFAGILLRHVGEKLRAAGYAAMFCDSMNDPELEKEHIRFLLNKKVDGLLVIPVAENPDFLEPAFEENVPVVLMDRSIKDPRLVCVKVDNRSASEEAVRLLSDYGHRKIAIIGSTLIPTGRERFEGCIKVLRERKIDIPEEYLKLGQHSIEHGYRSMQELLALSDPPTAVFMGNFEIILGVVMAVNESSFEYPRDISLIGFDDLLISNLSNPRLWLAVQPMQEMAWKAADLLLSNIKLIREGQEPVHNEIELPVKIIPGCSIAHVSENK